MKLLLPFPIDNASADYLDTANAKEIILDPVSSKETDDDGKMTGS